MLVNIVVADALVQLGTHNSNPILILPDHFNEQHYFNAVAFY